MSTCGENGSATRTILESRLACHLRCLQEDGADPKQLSLERLTLAPGQAARIRKIRWELEAAMVMNAMVWADDTR
jgi:hypothetical protein